MKITKQECYLKAMKLALPYTIAYDTIDRCENVIYKLTTQNGITGFGCAAPDPAVTGETARDVKECFVQKIDSFLHGENVFEYARIMEMLKVEIPDIPSARTMIDMAIFDIISQVAGVPLYKLLGGYRSSIPTSITVGILPLADTLSVVDKHIKNGFTIIKVKGGLNLQEDIEKIIRIREKYGKGIKIRFDANQGYSVKDSQQFIAETRNSDVELFEQPTPKNQLEYLKQVAQSVPIPVMADESILSLKDVFALTKNNCMDMINIKLMKTGGILEAMHINSVAKAAGVEAMVGCMDESALGISAGLHFSLSRPNIIYADLDGHLDLLDDPFYGLVEIKDGILFPHDNIPGLGWRILKNIDV